MSVFAGFWVDGAVRQPEQRHCDSDDTVVAKWKRAGGERTMGVSDEFDICKRSFSKWDCVYWLDTAPRESLTPEELFSLLKVIWPNTQVVNNPEGGAVVEWQVPHDATQNQTPISWGGLTQYPPDLDWVRVTKDNVSQHLFKDCRHRDREGVWRTGQIIGWSLDTDRCIVHNGYPDFCACVEVRVQGAE